MAIDQSFISNDLRPLNINRTAPEDPQLRPVYYHVVAPDSAPGGLGLGYSATPNSFAAWTPPPLVAGRPSETASDEGSDDPSPRKVKFLCSFGGRILPRPGDGALRYVGGQTRIVSVRREIRFPELMEKMVEIYGESVAIKYQLPEEDLDALVSVSCSEDLANLMEEYERAVETPSSEGSGKIRVFLFSALELDPSGVMQIGDLSDGGQRYVDAVNGIPSPDCAGSIRRKESVASASSTQNSDGLMSVGEVGDTSSQGEPGDGASLAALSPTMSPTGVVSHGGGRLVYMPSSSGAVADSAPLNLPPIITGHPQSFSSSAGSDPESERQFSGTGQSSSAFSSHVNVVDYRQVPTYVQSYSELHPETFHNRIDYLQNSSQVGYMNPQSFGPGRSVYWRPDHSPQQLQSHQFAPMIHSSVSPSSPPMSAPNAGQHQYVQLHQMRVDPFMEESSFGARSIQIPADQIYSTFQFQPRAQSPGRLLPGQTVEQLYNWRQVQAVPSPDHVIRTDIWVPQSHQQAILSLQSEKTSKQEDCYMCQKELPHAHSDTILQDHGIPGIAKTISDTDAVLQSHHPDESMRSKLPQRVAVAGGEVPIEHQNEQQRALGVDVNALGFQGAGIRPKFVGHIDPTVRDVTASQLASYGFPQVPESQHGNERIMPKAENPDYQRTLLPLGLVGFPGDGQASYGMLLGNVPQSPQEAVLQQPAIPSKYQVKQDKLMNKTVGADVPPGRTVAFQTSEPSVPGQNLVFVQKEDTSDVSHDYLRPIDGRIEALRISPTEISGITEQYRSQIKPMDSPTNDVKAENLLLGVDSGIRVTEPFVLSNANIGREDILDNVRQIAGKDSYMINAFIKPGVTLDGNYGKCKDEASRIQNRGIFNDAAAPTKDSLFSNQDPWNLRSESQFPVPTNSNGESCLGSAGELSMAAQIKEGSFHQPLEDLNKDTHAETIRFVKEEQIRHELQSVAEGVAASVLLPPIPFASVLSERERDESFPETNQDGEVLQNDEETQTTLVQDLKNKLLDKTNPSLAPIAEGINRLQIIKNSDLEELRELGSGTFGTVYHGKWRGTDVAIKRINDRCFAGKPSEQERLRDDFWNEACNLADLHHPNVVAFYGVVLDGPGGSVATVTEYMVNGSLRHALQRNDRALDYRKRLFITMDVAFGMEYLHGKNIVHFDLKSDNLLVNLRDPQRPICKVGDLGLSKVKCQTLISGGVRGTLPWMAPELLNGSSSMVSDKVDVFSFGIVMWELLTGDEPYADLHYGAIIGGIVSNTLRPAVPKTCDPQWRSLMERCWSSEPLERPTFAEIADTLRSMAASLPPKGHAQHHHAP
ncbi:hypothetical protein MRB53_017928 [Persea americana]|uniref:Uncharacterized protein n=1 Tax=Persea americana TaxID=3435 RepID=A0ACC2M7D9_PERAE|nr:hypothetical protein MRB53_017928 [Persea americana]